MKIGIHLVPAAVLLALYQAPSLTAAQTPQTPITPATSASAAAPKAALVAKAPADWIHFDDASYTPVISLRPKCSLPFIATAADLDEWLAALRTAAQAELDKGNYISL